MSDEVKNRDVKSASLRKQKWMLQSTTKVKTLLVLQWDSLTIVKAKKKMLVIRAHKESSSRKLSRLFF
jgi:hypothetical protein